MSTVLLLIIFCIICCLCLAEIYDPLNVFCGSLNCYEVLGVDRNANTTVIKKAFRKLSLTKHPDKSKDDNATENYRVISKAFDVLTGNESRPSFDYYLDHPRDYFKVSGHHYIRNIPKSDVRLVILIVLSLISWFFHVIQQQKYEKAVKYLKHATMNNLGVKNGGSRQTLELYKRAAELYDAYIKEQKGKGNKAAGKIKMQKDPIFEKFVDQIVSEVKIEGGYRKPEWNDLIIVRLFYSPYHLFLYAKKYHRRYISKEPLPMEDRIEMSKEMVGLGSWEELTPEEQSKLIEQEIWKQEVYDKWMDQKEAEELKKQAAGKGGKKASLVKKKRNAFVDETDENTDYIE